MGATTLASNFTTSAITVAGARGLCQVGAPRWPVLEATIAGMHQVCSLETARERSRHAPVPVLSLTNLKRGPSCCPLAWQSYSLVQRSLEV